MQHLSVALLVILILFIQNAPNTFSLMQNVAYCIHYAEKLPCAQTYQKNGVFDVVNSILQAIFCGY